MKLSIIRCYPSRKEHNGLDLNILWAHHHLDCLVNQGSVTYLMEPLHQEIRGNPHMPMWVETRTMKYDEYVINELELSALQAVGSEGHCPSSHGRCSYLPLDRAYLCYEYRAQRFVYHRIRVCRRACRMRLNGPGHSPTTTVLLEGTSHARVRVVADIPTATCLRPFCHR